MSFNDELIDEIGDNHIITSVETPLLKDAFELSDEEKIKGIEQKMKEIMELIGLDLTDDSLKGTPRRIAKMYVKEIFRGLNVKKKPKISTFKNKCNYNEMLVEKNISVYSTCEHHFLPIVGKAHIAYISNGNLIGLSKLNRVVDYYAKRPQGQERLTTQIVRELQESVNMQDVACIIDAKHLCVSSRGIQDVESSTITSEFGGRFKKEAALRKEFIEYIQMETQASI